jgi:hypothetical protein
VAGVLATAAVEELRDRHVGKPEGIVEFAVSEQTAIGGDPRPVELELDPAVENGPQRQLFGFTRRVPPGSRPVGRVKPLKALTESGDNVTRHSTYPGNSGLYDVTIDYWTIRCEVAHILWSRHRLGCLIAVPPRKCEEVSSKQGEGI